LPYAFKGNFTAFNQSSYYRRPYNNAKIINVPNVYFVIPSQILCINQDFLPIFLFLRALNVSPTSWMLKGDCGWNNEIVDGTMRTWMKQGDHKGRPYGITPK